jgi:hypothetical protein
VSSSAFFIVSLEVLNDFGSSLHSNSSKQIPRRTIDIICDKLTKVFHNGYVTINDSIRVSEFI